MSKKSALVTTFVGIISSLLAFLGVASCCIMPIIAGALAWFGIGASQIDFLAEYSAIFIGVAIVSLIFGFWQLYFKKSPSCCAATSSESIVGKAKTPKKSKLRLFQEILLWIGAIAVIFLLLFGSKANNATETKAEPAANKEQSSSCCPK